METGRTWLFLEPERLSPDELDLRLEEATSQLTARARARRMKTLGWPPVRECDLAPSAERLAAIEETGCEIVRVIRYVGAVVVTGDERAVRRAERLEFVRQARPVMSFSNKATPPTPPSIEGGDSKSMPQRDNSPTSFEEPPFSPRSFEEAPFSPPSIEGGVEGVADYEIYGNALRQSLLVNLPAAHAEGFRGRGVLIGVQDTGFDYARHNCFDFLQVAAQYDFLNDDANVRTTGDRGDGRHGTRVFSVIAGLDSGYYIGVAPEAQFVLTKTENTASETQVEEDLWVAGLWFHDSLGVDVLSSSLSYREWWDYEDLDGETSVTSRAADSAFAAGMVIVNSMGNTGTQGYPESKLGVPADARGVISVGGVYRDSTFWMSSSQGPTFDGRLKPNVVAQSSGVYTLNTSDDSTYTGRSGTSFSTPMVAGIVALIIEANPELTSTQVMDILQRTASRHDNPDTLYGYGIPDALAAVRLAREMEVTERDFLPQTSLLSISPNPANGVVRISYPWNIGGGIEVVELSGRSMIVGQEGQSGLMMVDVAGWPAGSYWVGSERLGWRRLAVVK